jgi:D-alanyl-D-alanine carboxypeptidase
MDRIHLGRLHAAVAAVVGFTVLVVVAGCAGRPPAGSAGLQQTLDEWRERSGASAAVLAVDGPGTTWTGSSGTRRPGAGAVVTTRDRFRVASITKLFVATVVLQLVEEGQVELGDPLAEYVPGFPRAERITLRQLLAHTSGVPDYTQIEGFGRQLLEDRERVWTVAEVLALAGDRQAEFEPGEDYAYSNTGFVLLGEVVRVATGTSWAHQVRTRILDPLDLRDTYVAGTDDAVHQPPVVPAYFDVDGDGFQENVETGGPWPAEETTEGAAGAMVSTAGDLLRFGDALFRGRLLDDASLAAMTREGPHHPRNSGYGLGLEVQRRDYRTTTWGHGGFVPGFRSTLRYLPDHDVLVVALVNDSLADADDLAELAYRPLLTEASS